MMASDAPIGCTLCVSGNGVYDFGRVCCCARFVCSVPLKALRAGWMERFKSRSSAEFFEQIERAVRARWVNKKIIMGEGNGNEGG